MDTNDVKPHNAILQYMLLLLLSIALIVLFYHTVPAGNERYVDVLLGAVIGAFTTKGVNDA